MEFLISMFSASLLVGLPSVLFSLLFFCWFLGFFDCIYYRKKPIPPIISNYVYQCLLSISINWDSVITSVKTYRLSHDFVVFQCIGVVFVLKLISSLRAGPKTLAELVEITKVNRFHLNALMRVLSGQGCFIYNEQNKTFEINEFNLSDKTDTIYFFSNFDCITSLLRHRLILSQWDTTQNKCKSDRPVQYSCVDFLNLIGEKDSLIKIILESAMSEKSTLLMFYSQITKQFNFSRFKQIVELGGGFGFLGFQILEDHPRCSVVVLENEETIKNALEISMNDFEKSKLIEKNQISFLEGSMFLPANIPSANAYIITGILSTSAIQVCAKILQAISAVMRNEKKMNGTSPSLIIIDSIKGDQSTKNEIRTDFQDFEILTKTTSQVVTWSFQTTEKRYLMEYEALFRDCELNLITFKQVENSLYNTLIELTA